MTLEIFNKEQFLKAVEEDPSLLIVTNTHINNEGQKIIFFSCCSEPFTMDEYNELRKEYIHDLEAFTLRAERMVEIHSPIPPLKGESVFSPKNIGRTHLTGIPKEWLKNAINIEIVHSDDTLGSGNPKTLHLGTISKDEFIDTIRRYYLDGIIPYEDLKHIKYITEKDIDYITR